MKQGQGNKAKKRARRCCGRVGSRKVHQKAEKGAQSVIDGLKERIGKTGFET